MKNKTSNSKCSQRDFGDVRVSMDYPWKVLSALHDDLSQFLNDMDNTILTRTIRSRSMENYMSLSQDWSLQRIASSDISLSEMRAKYQLASLLKKFKIGTDDARKSAALDKFYAAETTCKIYNYQGYKSLSQSKDQEIVSAYTYALSFVKKVIGEEPIPSDHTWCRHGPGASLDSTSGFTSQYHKFAEWPYAVSNRAFGHGVALISNDERWLGALEDDFRNQFNIDKNLILNKRAFWRHVFHREDCNRITTVPKTYLIDRTIAIEPTMNLFLQLGVDGFIRRNLKRWDVNLDDQSKNQQLAKTGSITGEFATIDLAAASDTISLRLCKLLLPPAWYTYLLDLRAPYGSVEGKLIKYHKISSMGNGYTFALESLLFSALVYGVLRTFNSSVSLRDCAVYGDDIIIPTDTVKLFLKVFNAAGFTINEDKSFTTGKVRESCGADWSNGNLIRPVFFSEFPKKVTSLFSDYNRLRRNLSLYWGIGDESKALMYIRKQIPIQFQTVTGPLSDVAFDSHIHCESTANAVFTRGHWKYPVIVSKSSKAKAANFNFRKLMDYLRPRLTLQGSGSTGSKFDATKRNASYLTKIYSTADFWQTEYTPVVTSKVIF